MRRTEGSMVAPPPSEQERGPAAARIALGIILLLFGLYTLRSFIPALVWSAVFAIAVWPLYRRVAQRCGGVKHDVLVPLGFTLAIGLIFVGPLGALAMVVSREAHGAMAWVQDVRQHGLPVPDFLGRIPEVGPQITAWWQANLSDPSGYADLLDKVNRGQLITYTRDVGAQVAHRSMLFAFTLVALFFLFRDGLALADQMLRASRRAFGASGERVALQMVASVHGTVDGLVLVGLGEGILMGVIYGIAGVPHPAMLAVLTGIAAIIPFGAPVAFGIAALLLLAKGSTVAAIVVFAAGMAIATVADHFIRPGLIGGATHLPFLWVLLGILGGVETWGLLGLFVGPAIMSALISLWREFTEPSKPKIEIEPATGEHQKIIVPA